MLAIHHPLWRAIQIQPGVFTRAHTIQLYSKYRAINTCTSVQGGQSTLYTIQLYYNKLGKESVLLCSEGSHAHASETRDR